MDFKKIILIIPYRGIGDLIFHLPLMRGLYQKYNSKLILITNSSNKAKFLLKNEELIKKIEYINFERENQIKNSYLFLKILNKYKTDLSILTAPSKRLTIPLLFSKSKKKIFYKKNSISDLSKYIFDHSKKIFPNIKFEKNYQLTWKKKILIKGSIFLSIDSHHDQNNWEQQSFIDLIISFLKIKKIKKIYVNFSPNKILKFRDMLEKFDRNEKIIFTYNDKFEKIIEYIRCSKFVVGNESGPTCLGASFRKKVFSIYNPKFTPNLSSKIIDDSINYFNSKTNKKKFIINSIIKKIK